MSRLSNVERLLVVRLLVVRLFVDRVLANNLTTNNEQPLRVFGEPRMSLMSEGRHRESTRGAGA